MTKQKKKVKRNNYLDNLLRTRLFWIICVPYVTSFTTLVLTGSTPENAIFNAVKVIFWFELSLLFPAYSFVAVNPSINIEGINGYLYCIFLWAAYAFFIWKVKVISKRNLYAASLFFITIAMLSIRGCVTS